MPASIKLQQEYGEDLAVLFVESQNSGAEKTERFIMKQRWFGNPAMWTNEQPFSTGSGGLPNFALLSADGKVLAKGNHVSKKTRELIEDEIRGAKGAPEGTPKQFKKAWGYFAKDSLAKAIAAAEKVGAKEEFSTAAAETIDEFTKRTSARLERIEWCLENGFSAQASDKLKDLLKAVKGAGELEEMALAVEERMEGDELKVELEASEALEKALAKLYADGRDAKLFAKVGKLAEKYPGTKAAERAEHIATLKM